MPLRSMPAQISLDDFHPASVAAAAVRVFAEAFAAIASKQRPALVDMLVGDTRTP